MNIFKSIDDKEILRRKYSLVLSTGCKFYFTYVALTKYFELNLFLNLILVFIIGNWIFSAILNFLSGIISIISSFTLMKTIVYILLKFNNVFTDYVSYHARYYFQIIDSFITIFIIGWILKLELNILFLLIFSFTYIDFLRSHNIIGDPNDDFYKNYEMFKMDREKLVKR